MRIIKSFTLVILIGIASVGLTVTSARAAILNLDTNATGDPLVISVNAKRAGFPASVAGGCPCEAAAFPGAIVDVRFDSGIYTSTLVFNSSFAEWFAGPNTGGNRTQYSVGIGNDSIFSGTVGQSSSSIFFQAGEHQTFANTVVKTTLFTILTTGTVLSFGVTDNLIGDNSGGVTLSLARTGDVNVIPLPAALPLYGTGLAVMGFLGWRRKRKVTAGITD